jgi:gamma-glutamyltranspeptidase/glutathione hydrolase
MVACTVSGGWFQSSPVIEGLGFPLGTRGQMFYLNPNRPNALAPHKRPRTTLTPTLVTRDGQPFLAFGTQGGDAQDQWTLQFFLNYWVFGMDLQAALDAPTAHSEHFPSSFYPHNADTLRVSIEGRISSRTRSQLAGRGHLLSFPGDWAHGRVLAVCFDQENGILQAAASPRQSIAYAIGW